jgi:hypothetical protein
MKLSYKGHKGFSSRSKTVKPFGDRQRKFFRVYENLFCAFCAFLWLLIFTTYLKALIQRLIPATPQCFVALNPQSGKPLTLKGWVYRIGGVQEKLPPLLTSQANSGGK